MSLEVRNLVSPFGAEVVGLRPSIRLDADVLARLRQVFDERGWLLFRNLDIAQPFQENLCDALIGLPPNRSDPDVADSTSGQDDDRFYVSNRRTGASSKVGRLLFHSDTMWSDDPFQALSLYAVEVEPPVVPTIFASATSAWDNLPEDLRERVVGRSAVHTAGQVRRDPEKDRDLVVSVPETPKSTTKPIAHRHPRTGRTILYVNEQMTHEVVGLSLEEGDRLLEALFAHLYRPENLLRHEWQEGDLVVWDNLAVQHSRPNVTAEGPARTLRRFASPDHMTSKEDMRFNYHPMGAREDEATRSPRADVTRLRR